MRFHAIVARRVVRSRVVRSVLFMGWFNLRRSVAALLFVLGALVSAPTYAEAPSAKDQAFTRLEKGARLLNSGDFSGALVEFQEAHRIYPSPKLFYNLGLAYKGLGKSAFAFLEFERFLAEVPSDTPPQQIAHARQQLEQLSRHLAFAYVTSDVAEADVTMDGQAIGHTVLPRRFPAETGPHKITLASGLRTTTQAFSAVAGESVTVNVLLGPPALAVAPMSLAPAAIAEKAEKTEKKLPQVRPTPTQADLVQADERAAPRKWLPVARWTTLGLAATGVGLGAIFNTLAVSKRQQFDDVRPDQCQAVGDVVVSGPNRCGSLANDFSAYRRNSEIAYVAGGALAVGSAILFLLNDGSEARSSIAPGTLGTPAGVSYARRF